MMYLPFLANSQIKPTLSVKDSSFKKTVVDSTKVATKSTDSEKTRQASRTVIPDSIKIADSDFEEEVDFGAVDTMRFDPIMNQVHLYGDAFVKYQNYEIKAGYILYDFEKKTAAAESTKSELDNETIVPSFSDGSSVLNYQELKYSFITNKGIVKNSRTAEGEFFLHGAVTKFISKNENEEIFDDQIFNKDALITTCDEDHPHFGIRARRLKVIPDKLAVAGLAQLEIAGIPAPLFLPFSFFPILEGKRSGIIFPRDYEYSPRLGFGFREIGYYFPINDYMDMRVTGDIYTRGSWGLRVNSNYKKRYKYSGTIGLGYSLNRVEDNDSADVNKEISFSININHNPDPKAHPYKRFGGKINIRGNRFDQINFNSAEAQLNNTYSSNLNFSNSLPGSPFNYALGLSHSQNTQTNRVKITFPDATLRMKTIFPFKRKNRGGNSEKWFEKISLQYNSKAKNEFNTTDTTFFSQQTLEEAKFGISHDVTTNASYRVFKYFNLSQSVRYEEDWNFRVLRKTFDPTPVIDPETGEIESYGSIIEDIETAFAPVRSFDASINLNTALFGTIQFSKGKLRGIRHILKPSFGFVYSPGQSDKYVKMVDTDSRPDFNEPETYNELQNSLFGQPRFQERQMSMSYGFNNVVEAKYYSKKDSTEKKFKIIENLGIDGRYNFAADTLKWSTIAVRGNTSFFKGVINLTVTASLDPYLENDKNQRINQTVWSQDKKLFRIDRAELRIGSRASIKQIRDLFRGNVSNDRTSGQTKKRIDSESFLDMFDNFQIAHNIVFTKQYMNGVDTSSITVNSINSRGQIKLTPKWNIDIGNFGYDFKNKRVTYPDFGLSRDLHCWNLNFRWQPFQGTYNFFIGVNSNALSFIKHNYRRNNFDGRF